MSEKRIFGPVPSRRLGMSLGVNNIPHKVCTYSCIYCQIGKTKKQANTRQSFFTPESLYDEVTNRLQDITDIKEYPDYIAIVPDGEPTLDIHLGKLILKLKETHVKVAVITNASLVNIPGVREDLSHADFVSLKTDAVSLPAYRKMNRPHKALIPDDILRGMHYFSRMFKGKLVTETMLLKGLNDSYKEMESVAHFISSLNPDTAYLAIPTRPPAWVSAIPADEKKLNEAYHIFSKSIKNVEFLTGYEGNAFSSTGNPVKDILSITAVHPMRYEAIEQLLERNRESFSCIEELITKNLIRKVQYQGEDFYIRQFIK